MRTFWGCKECGVNGEREVTLGPMTCLACGSKYVNVGPAVDDDPRTARECLASAHRKLDGGDQREVEIAAMIAQAIMALDSAPVERKRKTRKAW